MVVGEDFHFGHGRKGNVALLREMGSEAGFAVEGVSLRADGGAAGPEAEPISSTRIRSLVGAGRVEEAAVLLGRPHQVRGEVVHGDHRGGAELGFPTANVDVPDGICLPAAGIYAGWYERPDGSAWKAAMSVGRRPTFYGTRGDLLVEAFLLDFAGDLYGEEARVSFVSRLRDELAFDTSRSSSTRWNGTWPPPGCCWRNRAEPAAAARRVGDRGQMGRRLAEELGAELALEDLAGRIAGQRLGPEPEPGGHVERGQPLADESGQLVGAHVLTGPQHHDGPDLLAEDRVGHADDGAVGHGRVLEEGGLHLDAVDVLAAPDDHVLGPVDDVDEALLVDAGHVAGVQPSAA